MTPTPSDAQPVAPTKPRCAKPGCGALHIVGHPCTDWDCPQQYVSAADYRAVESALDAERQKREEAERDLIELRRQFSPGARFDQNEAIGRLADKYLARAEAAEAPLTKAIQERDDYRRMFDECAVARDASGFLGTVPQCIEHWSRSYEAAEASLAKANARIAELSDIIRRLLSPKAPLSASAIEENGAVIGHARAALTNIEKERDDGV
jgi:hypothetical protein